MDKNTSNYNKKDSLLESLVLYTKLYHKPYSAQSLMAGLPASHFYNDNFFFTNKMKIFFLQKKTLSRFYQERLKELD